ncbi:Glyoxalase/Bleomycin resistance protein/Dihydroxybiphenyl dioxygenase [Achaetomium macrosporum]|uniref:Glyoxalase/Bleomycin resistance protein/Dihydroxybiphenyl dioxygenase n=1 Tax=Achaetomium macrosporum TaxID=79813 RepID=A0AAN7HA52_9PEZI|nr:Glyoxalase/Bleomycin resistance protein/Dihydroxybiphenyl dioxygenase [Achaetomium macrosporum]
MTIAHTGIKVPATQHAAVVAWYEAALACISYKKAMAFAEGQVVGFADSAGSIDWWITAAADATTVLPTHTAFVANDRASVDRFHADAVAAGGKCNGKPGIRPFSGPTYYAAFVLDPVGNNIEVVCTAEV